MWLTLYIVHSGSFAMARFIVVVTLLALLDFGSHSKPQVINKIEIRNREQFLKIGTGYIETKGREPRNSFSSNETSVSDLTQSILSSITFSRVVYLNTTAPVVLNFSCFSSAESTAMEFCKNNPGHDKITCALNVENYIRKEQNNVNVCNR